MKNGDTVILKSFNLSIETPSDCEPDENYWQLIGKSATVVDDVPKFGIEADRILIQFDCDVQARGLHCHNHIENSLWIKRDDLSIRGGDASYRDDVRKKIEAGLRDAAAGNIASKQEVEAVFNKWRVKGVEG